MTEGEMLGQLALIGMKKLFDRRVVFVASRVFVRRVDESGKGLKKIEEMIE